MFCKLVVLLACLMGAALGEKAPVFMMGSNSPSKPALYTITEDEFAEIMRPKAKEGMIVVFLENGRRCSGFACSKSSSGASCFSNLKGDVPKSYYSSVENPIEAIGQVSIASESAIVDSDGNLGDVTCKHGKTVMVDLSILTEGSTNAFSREQLLNEVVAKAYKELSKNCKITAVFTRKPSTSTASKSRRRRALDKPTSGTTFRSGTDFLLFYTELILQTLNSEQKPQNTKITMTEMNLTGKNETAFTVNLKGASNKMSFLISQAGGYFKMSTLKFDDEPFYVSPEVTSPTDFSYACGNQTFSNTTSNKMIIWNSLQMQAPFNNQTEQGFKFGDPWYCVGFFSIGILAALFVVLILLFILGLGICWMFDINTMDRFDDPKGKTISINVNE